MVQIVSGIPQDQFDGGAVLRGFKDARRLRQEADAERRLQMNAALELQQTKLRLDKAKADALSATNKRAQLGEVQALKQQEMERIAAGLPPEIQRLGEYTKLRQSLLERDEPNMDAVRLLDAQFAAIEGQIKQEKGYAAADSEIQRALKDGLLDEAAAQSFAQRLQAKRQSGEPADDMLTEISKARMERSVKSANAQENAEALKQIDAAISAMPPGREKKLAMIAAEEFRNSPSLQEQDGAGAKVLAEIQKIAVGPMSRFDDIQEATKQRALAQPAPGLPGMTVGERTAEMEREPFVGFGGPEVPPFQAQGPRAHATVKAGAGRTPSMRAIRKALPALIGETTNPAELAQRLREQGVPLTKAVLAEARKALEGRKTSAQAQGGADR